MGSLPSSRGVSSRSRSALFALFALASWAFWIALCAPVSAQVRPGVDWWQWGGPTRDFVAPDVGLQASWEERKPVELFRRKLDGGHAAVSVGDGRVFVFHGSKGRASILAMTTGGVTLWERKIEVAYTAPTGSHDGPHSAPLILDGVVVTVAIDATVRAWNSESGELVWSRDLKEDLGVTLPQAGYAASPLAVGEQILLPGLGGPGPGLSRTEASDLGILSLNWKTGATVWRAEAFPSSHASPLLIDGPEPVVVFHGLTNLVAVRPGDGERVWSFALRNANADNVSFLPIWNAADRTLIVSHAYGEHGTQAIALDESGPRRVWASGRAKVQHGNGVLWDGMFLASDGGEPGFLVALDATTGDLLWKERMPKATFLRVDERFVLILDADGTLHLAQPTREGSGIVSNVEVLDELSWTAPTLVGRTLYVRGPKALVALRLP